MELHHSPLYASAQLIPLFIDVALAAFLRSESGLDCSASTVSATHDRLLREMPCTDERLADLVYSVGAGIKVGGPEHGFLESRLGFTWHAVLDVWHGAKDVQEAKPNLDSGRSMYSQRTELSAGARLERVRCIGVRDRTPKPLSLPIGFVDSMNHHTFAASAAQSAPPGFMRNSLRPIMSGSCPMIASMMRAMRAPPPC
jgi:hypothetical protein